MKLLHSFSWLTSIPLQCSCLKNPWDGGAWWSAIYGVVELDTTEVTQQQQQQYSIVWMWYIYHVHIHSSVNGRLGHFHVLAIVNSAAMNIRVHVPF